jgi:hypothetical protein
MQHGINFLYLKIAWRFLLRMLPEYVAGYGIFLKCRATFTPHMVMA